MLKASEIRKMVAVPIFFALRGFFRSGLILLLFLAVAAPALAQSGTWTTKAPMSQGVHNLAAVERNRRDHIPHGGWPGNTCGGGGGQMEAYDPAANTWTTPRLRLPCD